MKYKKLTGIILKKQNYKEADQIVTIWSREEGKFRVLAKGIRLSKSKLAHALSDLNLAEVQIAGNHLPILTGARPMRQFNSLLTDLQKAAVGFYAAELMMKLTGDEHPNEPAFELLLGFLENLEASDYSLRYQPLLECFTLDLLEALGFKMPQNLESSQIMAMDLDQIEQTHRAINRFVEYILERSLKSENLLAILR